ncbi:hypothetical protein EYF80_065519 [Liparis tanakae]|uniref:Uncharacterized protein n=1 Tax=Liparis tanakae TaxID=230148 RepID=A0A4Z2E6H5_9TELE|nr:hypothetical protein EYF80_065519 [Liparis tanakae]
MAHMSRLMFSKAPMRPCSRARRSASWSSMWIICMQPWKERWRDLLLACGRLPGDEPESRGHAEVKQRTRWAVGGPPEQKDVSLWRRVPVEACPCGGVSRGGVSPWGRVPVGACSCGDVLGTCPCGDVSLWGRVPVEACPCGGVSPWRRVPVGACPVGECPRGGVLGTEASLAALSLTSEVVRPPRLYLDGDGGPDGGRLVPVHRQHGVVLQRVQVHAVPLAVVQPRA